MGVNSTIEGERVNLIMKILATFPATTYWLWAVSAQAATNDDIAKRLEPAL